jgi:uncharacterized membrane protein YccF (DUF307 family)
MAFLGNIIWFVLGGWLLFLLYTLAAILFFPVFLPIFRIARYSLFPFGKSIVSQNQLNKYRELVKSKSGNDTAIQVDTTKTVTQGVSGVLNILWMITFGWVLALIHFFSSLANLALFFLIITIPNIGGHWKMMKIAFLPFNRVIVPKQLAEEIEIEIAKGKLKI